MASGQRTVTNSSNSSRYCVYAGIFFWVEFTCFDLFGFRSTILRVFVMKTSSSFILCPSLFLLCIKIMFQYFTYTYLHCWSTTTRKYNSKYMKGRISRKIAELSLAWPVSKKYAAMRTRSSSINTSTKFTQLSVYGYTFEVTTSIRSRVTSRATYNQD